MRLLLFGGSGTLGKELIKLDSNIIAPTHDEISICDSFELHNYIEDIKPDIIINAAAITDNRQIEKMPCDAINTNIIGASNLASICTYNNIRLVYISTDYIYKGDRGNYKESDEILPYNLYAWTKLGGECATRCVNNHLIIRTTFGANDFKYKQAFVDKWTSKDYVDKIAPLIYEAATSPLTGVLNLGTERKTLCEFASERNSDLECVKIEDTSHSTPCDTSLNLQKWINYKNEKSIAKPHINCRVCGESDLIKYLDLGLMPLANNLEYTSQRAKEKERFPLQIMYCKKCSLSQLSVVIDPGKMFSYYTYRSGVNKGYIEHCNKMAVSLKDEYKLNKDSFIIDIAGNDGTLLNEFKKVIDCNVLNIDPASNLTAISELNGVHAITTFWDINTATNVNKADIITATNVFAHVDSVLDFIVASKIALKEEGVLILEFPYLIDFIENYEFDTVYFEHLSYMSILPIMELCNITDMRMINVQKQNIHGGTVRVSISHKDSRHEINNSVIEFISNERKLGYDKIDKYMNWSTDINNIIKDFSDKLYQLKKEGKKIVAFAASAKGNTLLNACKINTDIIDYIIDETPEKIGKYSPGTGIPIVNKDVLNNDKPDYIIILSWNFFSEITEKLRIFGYKGKFIIPIPEYKITD